MFRLAVKCIGYLLVAMVFLGVALAALTAARDGQAFYGVNYWNLHLGTYSTLAMLAMVALIGAVVIALKVFRVWQAWRAKPGRPLV